MSTWLLIELILSTGVVICALLALFRKQVESLGFKIGMLIVLIGMAGDTAWDIYTSLGTLSEAAWIVQVLVLSNAVAGAVLVARLRTSRNSSSELA